MIRIMSVIARQECQACGHVLRDVDNGTCPYRVPTADPPHEFVEVEYVPRSQLRGAVEALAECERILRAALED